ncbi:MAG: aldehyde ferredoxin oxidoreductase family protein [Chloroflexi bacterium]|nr:aldehyde ferredoxin oxidoreductase family protein [Chloroflexota bacterium]
MTYGHWGKALRVDLTRGTIRTETLDPTDLRRYVGGWWFIAHTLLRELPPGADPLGPENILIFTTGPITGQPLAGGGRHMVGAKSPLTGGFAGSECGGFFGAELKRAGWDTVIITGASETPVYLAIQDGEASLRPADHLWGLETLECQTRIREEMGERLARVAQCGIAGENLALVANVIHDVNRAAGRTGLGAVMGSKRLKAVAVRGTQQPPVADADRAREIGHWFRDHYQETGSAVFSTLGTMRMVRVHQEAGGLPTRNFQEGQFDGFEGITAEAQQEQITVRRDTCYGCPVRCKWVVEVDDERYPVEPEYGGPEYETTGSFGHLCGVDDIRIAARANQLCNAYGLDTIGTGVTIAFAMECYERGLLGPDDTDGLELRFGNGDAMLEMIGRMARREGLGDLLCQGSRRAARAIGGGAEQYAVQVKGQEVAMHDPRIKYGHGLGLAVSPTGADHMHSVHDSGYQDAGGIGALMPLGYLDPLPYDDLSVDKARMVRYAMMWRVTYNLTGICYFHFYTPQQVADLIGAVTGWNTSVQELWLAAERAYDMARAFNAREGIGPEEDTLPPRLFEPLPAGPKADKVYSREEFERALADFYRLMSWDPETGAPTRAKLEDLGVGWVADELDKM